MPSDSAALESITSHGITGASGRAAFPELTGLGVAVVVSGGMWAVLVGGVLLILNATGFLGPV